MSAWCYTDTTTQPPREDSPINVQARRDRENYVTATARQAEVTEIRTVVQALADSTDSPLLQDVLDYLGGRLVDTAELVERTANRTTDNPVTCMFTIQKGTPAWDELEKAMGADGFPPLERISFDPRENGVAIKVDSGVWSPTLIAFRQPARRP